MIIDGEEFRPKHGPAVSSIIAEIEALPDDELVTRKAMTARFSRSSLDRVPVVRPDLCGFIYTQTRVYGNPKTIKKLEAINAKPV